MIRECLFCHREFKVRKAQAKYCSRKCCGDANRKDKVSINCLRCGKPLMIYPSLAKDNKYNKKKQFCSLSCASSYRQRNGSWNKGIPHTEEEKNNIGIGVKKSRAKGDYINPATRPEVRAKISKTIKELFKDPRNNPRYIDGRKGEKYPFDFDKEFKDKIRERDGYKCRRCGVPQYECLRALDVHHIDWDKHNLNEENLVVLCQSCHQKMHGKNGKNGVINKICVAVR